MFLGLINVNSECQCVKNVSELSSGCTCNFSSCISCVASFEGSGYNLRRLTRGRPGAWETDLVHFIINGSIN